MITIFSIGVNVFLYFRTPQESLDKRQALTDKEVDNKANVLAQQLQWEKESNIEKFKDMGDRLNTAMTLAQNHIHTVDTKVDGLMIIVGKMSNEITRLSTIIEERIPK